MSPTFVWLWPPCLIGCSPTKQVTARAEHLGSGLLHQGCQPNPNQFIGVFAQNRPEVTDILCLDSLSIFLVTFSVVSQPVMTSSIDSDKTYISYFADGFNVCSPMM